MNKGADPGDEKNTKKGLSTLVMAREVVEMMSKNLQRETREKGREEPTHLLVHCTNGYNSQDEAKPKPSDKCCVGGPVL